MCEQQQHLQLKNWLTKLSFHQTGAWRLAPSEPNSPINDYGSTIRCTRRLLNALPGPGTRQLTLCFVSVIAAFCQLMSIDRRPNRWHKRFGRSTDQTIIVNTAIMLPVICQVGVYSALGYRSQNFPACLDVTAKLFFS